MGARVYNQDKELVFKDAGLIAADAAAQVGGSNAIIDIGASTRFEAVMVVDVSAIEVATGDEIYRVLIQGSSSATFASDVENLAELTLGVGAARGGSAKTSVVGRYEMPFVNEQADTLYRYLRVYIDVAGTIATGINFKAFASTKY